MSRTPRAERIIIALIGRRNAGKSSLINAIVGQEIAIVSDTPGTTTDPVAKHYELVPLGPVTFYDTAGVDDAGDLGEKRIAATTKILYRTDIALFVNDGEAFDNSEKEWLKRLQDMKIPILMVFNKSDLNTAAPENIRYCNEHKIGYVSVSATELNGVDEARKQLIDMAPQRANEERVILGDLLKNKARVILVTPIDEAAPKGRLILPQVQSIRDALDHNAICIVAKDTELEAALDMLKTPADLVVTDSQAIAQVHRETPSDIELTTFSILFARYKGELDILIEGTQAIDRLKDNDIVLIAEACSHHAQEDDIGRAKIPRWLKEYCKKDLKFEVYAGHDFPEDLEKYALCIHCGGCMINAMEMNRRIMECARRGVPISNYGLVITKIHGAFERSIAPLLRVKQ